MRRPVVAFLFLANLLSCACIYPQRAKATTSVRDSDRDGLSDSLEAELLAAFAPDFMMSRTDCSIAPAQFAPAITKPTVMADDGTIYGQAFPRKHDPGEVELHYYHLWREDCGELGHALDTEHVSALVQLGKEPGSAVALLVCLRA